MPSRRLEDRIRVLCAKVVTADEGEFGSAFAELNSALHEHSDRLRKLAGRKLAGLKPEKGKADSNLQTVIQERRRLVS
jgi:predicted negative regulator of RcsB-dependent stress response